MERIALYARVSTEEQHPEAQLADLRTYAERRGAEAVEYVDHGVSGARRARRSRPASEHPRFPEAVVPEPLGRVGHDHEVEQRDAE